MSTRRATRSSSRRAAFERSVETLPGACAFAEDAEAMDPAWLVSALKAQPQLLAPLRTKAAEYVREDGRPREPGDWVLLYIAYVFSGETRVQRFHSRWASSGVWREAGFGDWKPSYQTVSLRFDEMETCGMGDAMRAAANLAVQQAKRHEDRIGRDIAVDATSYAANARLVHCCPDREACKLRPRFPKVLRAASGEAVEKHRHKTAKETEDDTGEGGELDNRLKPLDNDNPLLAALPEGPRYYLQHGHIYRCLDATAGGRSYTGEFWLGGLLMAAVDVFIGAPPAVSPMAADRRRVAGISGPAGECP